MPKLVLDLMGVLFSPSRIIKHGFSKALPDIPYERIKSAYKRAVVGDAWELNELIPLERQREILLSVVKPTFDFSIIKRRFYVLSNMPALWGVWLACEHLSGILDGLFISGSMGMKKPDPAVFKKVSEVVGGEIVFLDDKEENVASALKAGWKAHLVKDVGDVLRVLEEYEVV